MGSSNRYYIYKTSQLILLTNCPACWSGCNNAGRTWYISGGGGGCRVHNWLETCRLYLWNHLSHHIHLAIWETGGNERGSTGEFQNTQVLTGVVAVSLTSTHPLAALRQGAAWHGINLRTGRIVKVKQGPYFAIYSRIDCSCTAFHSSLIQTRETNLQNEDILKKNTNENIRWNNEFF